MSKEDKKAAKATDLIKPDVIRKLSLERSGGEGAAIYKGKLTETGQTMTAYVPTFLLNEAGLTGDKPATVTVVKGKITITIN